MMITEPVSPVSVDLSSADFANLHELEVELWSDMDRSLPVLKGMDAYRKSLSRFPSVHEQKQFLELYVSFQRGVSDRERKRAREAIVGGYGWLSFRLAARMQGCGVPFEDLVQEAMIGCQHALDCYDPSMGTSFATYAIWWMRHFMQRAVEERSLNRLMRFPTWLCQEMNLMMALEHQFYLLHGRIPDHYELWRFLQSSRFVMARAIPLRRIKRLRDMFHLARTPKSLDEPLRDDEANEALLGEFVADKNQDPETDAMLSLLAERKNRFLFNFEDAINELSPRDRLVLSLRIGFGENAMTLDMIGQRFGLTREYILHILKKTKAHLSLRLRLPWRRIAYFLFIAEMISSENCPSRGA